MKIWGLTGGIAAGKSLAAKFFAEAGIPVLDADQIARELSEPGGAATDAILKRFGTLDRQKLRDIVFQNPQARRDLEAILHPLIVKESQRRFEILRAQGQALWIYEASLLVETGRYRDFDGLIVIEAPSEKRRQRLMARDRISAEQADAILAAQTTDQKRRQFATQVFVNDGSPEDLRKKILDWIASEVTSKN